MFGFPDTWCSNEESIESIRRVTGCAPQELSKLADQAKSGKIENLEQYVSRRSIALGTELRNFVAKNRKRESEFQRFLDMFFSPICKWQAA